MMSSHPSGSHGAGDLCYNIRGLIVAVGPLSSDAGIEAATKSGPHLRIMKIYKKMRAVYDYCGILGHPESGSLP